MPAVDEDGTGDGTLVLVLRYDLYSSAPEVVFVLAGQRVLCCDSWVLGRSGGILSRHANSGNAGKGYEYRLVRPPAGATG